MQKKKIIFAHFVVGNTSRFELSLLLFIHLGMVKMIELIAVYSLTLNDDPPPLYTPEYIKEVCSVRYGGMDIILKLLFFFNSKSGYSICSLYLGYYQFSVPKERGQQPFPCKSDLLIG